MFEQCRDLERINVKNLDTRNVTRINAVFQACPSLKELDVSNWDISKVTTEYRTFASCTNLETLDISGWDFKNIPFGEWNYTFYVDANLTNLKFGKNWRSNLELRWTRKLTPESVISVLKGLAIADEGTTPKVTFNQLAYVEDNEEMQTAIGEATAKGWNIEFVKY